MTKSSKQDLNKAATRKPGIKQRGLRTVLSQVRPRDSQDEPQPPATAQPEAPQPPAEDAIEAQRRTYRAQNQKLHDEFLEFAYARGFIKRPPEPIKMFKKMVIKKKGRAPE